MKKKFAFAALCLIALAVFAEDIVNRTIRYRKDAVISIDGTVVFKDEDAAWTNKSPNFRALSFMSGSLVDGAPALQFGSQNFIFEDATNGGNNGIVSIGNGSWDRDFIFYGVSGQLWMRGAIMMGTNDPSQCPTAPTGGGGSAVVNSNGTTYLLSSLPNTATWASTNPVAPNIRFGTSATGNNKSVTNTFAPGFSSTPVVTIAAGTNDLPHLITVTTTNVIFGAAQTNASIRWIAIGSP